VNPVGGATLDDSDGLLAYQGIIGVGYSLTEQINLFVDIAISPPRKPPCGPRPA